MGYIKHEALLAISYTTDAHTKAEQWIASRGDSEYFALSGIMINGYWTMICFPDGSKEGWDESTKGNIRRMEMEDFVSKIDPMAKILYVAVDDEEEVSTRLHSPYLDEYC